MSVLKETENALDNLNSMFGEMFEVKPLMRGALLEWAALFDRSEFFALEGFRTLKYFATVSKSQKLLEELNRFEALYITKRQSNLSFDQAAHVSGLSLRYIRNLVSMKRLPAFTSKATGKGVIRPADLQVYLDTRKRVLTRQKREEIA